MHPLNPKQQKFADEYLIDGNSRQAVIRAGYSPGHAKQQAYYLLQHPAVQQYLADRRAALSDAMGIKAQTVLQAYARIAFFDIRDLYDENENLMPAHLLPPGVMAGVAGFEVQETYTGTGAKRTVTGRLVKVKLHNKIDALNALAKYLALFERNNRQQAQQQEKDKSPHIVFVGDMQLSPV